jgi:hypothetical protein
LKDPEKIKTLSIGKDTFDYRASDDGSNIYFQVLASGKFKMLNQYRIKIEKQNL